MRRALAWGGVGEGRQWPTVSAMDAMHYFFAAGLVAGAVAFSAGRIVTGGSGVAVLLPAKSSHDFSIPSTAGTGPSPTRKRYFTVSASPALIVVLGKKPMRP